MKQLLIIALLAITFASCEKETEQKQLFYVVCSKIVYNNPKPDAIKLIINNDTFSLPSDGGTEFIYYVDPTKPFYVYVECTGVDPEFNKIAFRIGNENYHLQIEGVNNLSFSGYIPKKQ